MFQILFRSYCSQLYTDTQAFLGLYARRWLSSVSAKIFGRCKFME